MLRTRLRPLVRVGVSSLGHGACAAVQGVGGVRSVSFIRVAPRPPAPTPTEARQKKTPQMTFMQEQTMLEQRATEAAAAALAAKQQAAPAAAAAGPSVFAREAPPAPLVHRSSLLLGAPSFTRARLPLSALDALKLCGLIQTSSSSSSHRPQEKILLMPQGKRIVRKLERRLQEELQALGVQEMETAQPGDVEPEMADEEEAGTVAATPYAASLHSSLARLTNLVAPSFRAGTLARASFRVTSQAPAVDQSAAGGLWPAAKPIDDIVLFDTKHAIGLERYAALVDALRLTLTAVGKTHAVETTANAGGLAQVDADLAHELHVEVPHGGKGARELLRCTKCDYAAKPHRALSIAAPVKRGAPLTVAPSPFSPEVQQQLQTWSKAELGAFLPQHAIDRLGLEQIQWKVELVRQAAGPSSSEPAVVYAILMRADHRVNLEAVGEHVALSTTDTIRRVDTDAEARDIQADAPNVEVLIDEALIPEELDIDMEVIEEEENQQDLMEGEEDAPVPDDDPGSNDAAPPSDVAADDDLPTPDSRLLARMEKQLKSLPAGSPIDFVALEAAARGLNAEEEKQKALREGMAAQKKEWEEREQETQEKMNQLKKLTEAAFHPEADASMHATEAEADAEAEQEGGETSHTNETAVGKRNGSTHVPSEAPSSSTSTAADASSSSSSSSSFIPSFSFSRQGFFRLAASHEKCGVCGEGDLQRVGTEILANTVFVGRQELVAPPEEEAAAAEEESASSQPFRRAFRGKRDKSQLAAQRARAPKVKKYLHTSMGRWSSFDAMAFAAVKNLHAPPPPTKVKGEPLVGNPLDSIPTVHYPPLVLPFQIVLIPITRAEVTNPRDRQRVTLTERELENQATTVRETTERLYQEIIQASREPTTPTSAMPIDFQYPSLAGDILIDDSYALPTAQRVHQSLGTGAPIILLVSPSSVAKSYCTLLLNKRGLPIEPRRIAMARLPQLMQRMAQSNYAAILQAKQSKNQQASEKQAELQRMIAEEGEGAEMQEEDMLK